MSDNNILSDWGLNPLKLNQFDNYNNSTNTGSTLQKPTFADKLTKYGDFATGLFDSYLGLSALNHAKKQFEFNKGMLVSNQNAQANLANRDMSEIFDWRLRRGVENPGAASNADYMSKWGISRVGADGKPMEGSYNNVSNSNSGYSNPSNNPNNNPNMVYARDISKFNVG